MIKNVAIAGLLTLSALTAPAPALADPGCELNCWWDAHYNENGVFTHWTYECPLQMICDAPAEPPPP